MFIKHPDTYVSHGSLTQVGPLFRIKGMPNTLAVFSCVCGNFSLCQVHNVKSGKSSSCGCAQRAMQSKRATRHGKRHSKVYNTWMHVKARCLNPNNQDYLHYGERGITLCDRWLDFNNFYADMGDPPSSKHSIERKNNNKGYSPDNCVWAVQLDQNRNKRNSRLITAFGKTMCLSQWSSTVGIPSYSIRRRIAKGWSAEDALTRP